MRPAPAPPPLAGEHTTNQPSNRSAQRFFFCTIFLYTFQAKDKDLGPLRLPWIWMPTMLIFLYRSNSQEVPLIFSVSLQRQGRASAERSNERAGGLATSNGAQLTGAPIPSWPLGHATTGGALAAAAPGGPLAAAAPGAAAGLPGAVACGGASNRGAATGRSNQLLHKRRRAAEKERGSATSESAPLLTT